MLCMLNWFQTCTVLNGNVITLTIMELQQYIIVEYFSICYRTFKILEVAIAADDFIYSIKYHIKLRCQQNVKKISKEKFV